MPLEGRAKTVMRDMKDRYGDEEGERVFYATANKQGRKPETWKKESADCLTGPLKAALTKRAAAARKPVDPLDAVGFYREETQQVKLADSYLGAALRGALLGGAVGAGTYGGVRGGLGARSAHRAAPHYDELLRELERNTVGMPADERKRVLEGAARQAPSRVGAGFREGLPAAGWGGLVGGGAGALVGILRHALRNRGRGRVTRDDHAQLVQQELLARREAARRRAAAQYKQQLGM